MDAVINNLDDRGEDIVCLIRQDCHTRTQRVGSLLPFMESRELHVLDNTEEVEVGGAVTFVLDVEQFLKT